MAAQLGVVRIFRAKDGEASGLEACCSPLRLAAKVSTRAVGHGATAAANGRRPVVGHREDRGRNHRGRHHVLRRLDQVHLDRERRDQDHHGQAHHGQGGEDGCRRQDARRVGAAVSVRRLLRSIRYRPVSGVVRISSLRAEWR